MPVDVGVELEVGVEVDVGVEVEERSGDGDAGADGGKGVVEGIAEGDAAVVNGGNGLIEGVTAGNVPAAGDDDPVGELSGVLVSGGSVGPSKPFSAGSSA